MDERTLTALKASIRHWEENLAATNPDAVRTGPDSCALCGEFFWEAGCGGCPVFEHAGWSACGQTPYENAWRAWDYWRRNITLTGDQFRAAAQAELDFLKSLLPEEK